MGTQRNPDYRLITKLLEDESFYQGIEKDGSFKLLSNIALVRPPNAYITERYLVAIALTEVCRKYGRGKVTKARTLLYMSETDHSPIEILYLPMPLPTKPSESAQNVDQEIWDVCLQVHGRLPALVYVPHDWTPVEKRIWDSWEAKDRLISLNARAGPIMRKDIVLPLDLIFTLHTPGGLMLNDFGGASGGCKAVLAVLPKVYLGWHSAIRPQGQETSDWYAIGEERLQSHQCTSARQVIDKLWDMFFECQAGSLVQLGSILGIVAEWQRANVDWKATRAKDRT
ncbi:MAG: hypothetical protein Q9186_003133 [Xanthomendoza sp. 1 TL-2023]